MHSCNKNRFLSVKRHSAPCHTVEKLLFALNVILAPRLLFSLLSSGTIIIPALLSWQNSGVQRLCFHSTSWINRLIRTPWSLLRSVQSLLSGAFQKYIYNTIKQQRKSCFGASLLKKELALFLQESDHASNNYATAYYTKSSSPLHIILQCEGPLGAVSASWEREFLCLGEQKQPKDCFLPCRHSNCSLPLNDPHKPPSACRDESGCLVAITETELLLLWPRCHESATVKFAFEEPGWYVRQQHVHPDGTHAAHQEGKSALSVWKQVAMIAGC